MVGIAIVYAPMLSWIAATRFFVCILYAFCIQFQIPVYLEDIVNVSPCETTLGAILNDNTLFLAINAANKKGIHHIVKVIAFWNTEEDELFTFELDSDGCVGTNFDTASGVRFSLKRLDFGTPCKLFGVCSDACRGGVGEGLHVDLLRLERVIVNV